MALGRVPKIFLAVIGTFVGIVSILLLVAVIRTLTIEEPDYGVRVGGAKIPEISEDYLNKIPKLFGEALRYKTVLTAPHQYDREQLGEFHKFLRKSFPRVFSAPFVKVEVINELSLLFTITGTENNTEPYMLTSHMDVVPADPNLWSRDPFSGDIFVDPESGEEVIFGRGAIDDKLGIMGIMCALEYMVKSDWKPKRSFYVGFGHDEEVSGFDGAAHIGKVLGERGVTLEFVLDEGMMILEGGGLPGVDFPMAMIGVSEKGFMTVRLETEGEGGHSSMPPFDQAVVRLSRALQRLSDNPQPSMFGSGPEADLFTYVAPKAAWPYKLVFSNLWLFGGILQQVMAGMRETNAMMRTTTALTMVSAGVKENVVPATAWAIVNHRVHPGQTLEEVLQHDKDVIDDPKVKLTVVSEMAPHPISPYGPDVPGYRNILESLSHFFPDALPVPSLLLANTDQRHYQHLTNRIYRFFPVKLTKEDIARIHGANEFISTSNFRKCVQFYRMLVTSCEDNELLSSSDT